MLDKVSERMIVAILGAGLVVGVVGAGTFVVWVGQGLYNLLRILLGTA